VIRAVGIVESDKTHREDLSLRYSGYIVNSSAAASASK